MLTIAALPSRSSAPRDGSRRSHDRCRPQPGPVSLRGQGILPAQRIPGQFVVNVKVPARNPYRVTDEYVAKMEDDIRSVVSKSTV